MTNTSPLSQTSRPGTPARPRRLLITAGPTHEPIDSVRFIGNRSSGKLGIAIAQAAARRGDRVTLLLGPVGTETTALADTGVVTRRFRTSADLQTLLVRHFRSCDLLIMAAAVADFRPKRPPAAGEKLKRSAQGLTLRLEPTPDLVAACAAARRTRHPQQIVGFALEPASRLAWSAKEKLIRKRLNAVVANPLETMDSDRIHATVYGFDDGRPTALAATGSRLAKAAFGPWLLRVIDQLPPHASPEGPISRPKGSSRRPVRPPAR
ncbi:MAG: phosphopantothenoylcysteine decarboxylase [Planctomycetaceae bacterium]|jgi:phosphopantothenoylcysteine decarboxylase/phosphopantothenate--cysteine ligase|nr:phosphopantothenoylcysteine decarboxylase [Phycisphaerales bacterium]MCE2652943.1 phosphopantothenoylcysteine decarboxylase [Planctomycetaceae bacterium]